VTVEDEIRRIEAEQRELRRQAVARSRKKTQPRPEARDPVYEELIEQFVAWAKRHSLKQDHVRFLRSGSGWTIGQIRISTGGGGSRHGVSFESESDVDVYVTADGRLINSNNNTVQSGRLIEGSVERAIAKHVYNSGRTWP
jgi:hypothetical protein